MTSREHQMEDALRRIHALADEACKPGRACREAVVLIEGIAGQAVAGMDRQREEPARYVPMGLVGCEGMVER